MAKTGLILPLLLAACAPVAMQERSPLSQAYRARGQEPGWLLTIAGNTLIYEGDYGETRIQVAAPEPRTTFNGHRYEAGLLIVDITHARCNDAMSGHGYADQVMIVADGREFRGCGGERRPDWDN
jgi:uncharacterized membrane protein